MTIQLKEDIAYILLKKINQHAVADTQPDEVSFQYEDFAGRNTDTTELLAHVDYLNQKGYLEAKFSGDAYAAKGPNPIPDLISLQAVALTQAGKDLLAKMEANPPEQLFEGPSTPMVTEDMAFLEKVRLRGNLRDRYDARDITEVVFRTIRDLMDQAAVEKVEKELHTPILPNADEKALQAEIADLWKDRNRLVRFLSNLRPPLDFDADTFLYRIKQEAGLPKSTGPKTVLSAVFAATKDELPAEQMQTIAQALPGEIRSLWEAA
ncbi:MAG: DUF2267 domain-containing protein [Cyanobacteria bacterium P01_A01_bin.114]